MRAKLLRRGFGLVCLLGAIGLLIAGELGATARLGVAAVLLYWLTCFLLTVMAFVTALWDAHLVRREAQAARRELFRQTFGDLGIEEVSGRPDEKRSAQRPPGRRDTPTG
jgi:Flp pilus assembly protein TadB